MAYKCSKCGTIVEELSKGSIRCPNCANKVFFKVRPPILKTVQAK